MNCNVKLVETYLKEMPEDKKSKLIEACWRHESFGGDFGLPNIEIYDCYGDSPKTSGFYIKMKGTRSAFNFYVNNDFEYIRKPRNVKVVHMYQLFYEVNFEKALLR